VGRGEWGEAHILAHKAQALMYISRVYVCLVVCISFYDIWYNVSRACVSRNDIMINDNKRSRLDVYEI
jgi:hypothetical protein